MKFTQREKRFPSATGLCDIRYRMWVPEEPRAAVQITHGMAEHIDRYDEFASFLAENGVLAYGNDIAGHGKSIAPGMPKGYFGEKNGWDAIVQDMRTMRDLVKNDYPGIPFILFGHSMGSFLARTYAGRDGADFDAFIFSGTAGSNPVLGIAKLIATESKKPRQGASVTLFNYEFGS
jgi:alpha-beta hydrolase superfamily lysophospholipase